MDLASFSYGGVYLLGFILYVTLPSDIFTFNLRFIFALFSANGAIIGGRLGYILIYEPFYYLHNPMEAIELWKGGMSFHGGIIGLVCGCFFCSYLIGAGRISFMRAVDRACLIALVIIPLGRCCNFMNGELWGRVTPMPWGVVFDGADQNPRHPVQLYEAFFEGPVMACFLFILQKKSYLTRPLQLSCWYLFVYSFFRFFTEFFREADAMIGYFYGFTLGQFLCLVGMLISLKCLRKIR